MRDRPIFTYQTRLPAADGLENVLSAYAALHGRAERSLFAALQAGGARNDLKRDFQKRFGITARQFNALRVGLDGKIASIKARRPELMADVVARIRKAEKVIAKLAVRCPGTNKLHQKKRRMANLRSRLVVMQADHANTTVRLCFGSRRLFRAQFDLTANGYSSFDAWRGDWQAARADQFFVLGSQDESAGNQTCQAVLDQEGSLTLTLRLPDALAEYGKQLTIPGLCFAYGHEAIVAALHSGRHIITTTKAGTLTKKRVGSALSYRFVRDAKGWRVFVSTQATAPQPVTCRLAGAIGIDINVDHLALAETDRSGNLIGTRRIGLPTYGKTTDQAKALIGDAAVAIAALAATTGKPVVIETLDFSKKKSELEATDKAQARMMSSFAYNKAISGIKAACFRAGILVIEVNPAYTSVIGAVNHARRHGISVHQGAALAVARRGLGLSEAPTVREASVPTRNGGHVTFSLPVRNREKHVWSHWSKIRTCLKMAHAAHFRSGEAKAPPAPLPHASQASGAIWISTAQTRGVNRRQHCSADVLDDVPG